MKVELRDLGHSIDNREVFAGISATVGGGQCLVVSGRSGSGKSLLFSIVCGILVPHHGSVLIDDIAISQMDNSSYNYFRQSMGVVFQVSALISNLTLRENLMLPLNQHCVDASAAQKQEKVKLISHEFGLDEYLDKRTDQLSTGLTSLAGFARALLLEPKCLVWDAPMAEIDLHWVGHVTNRISQLKANGASLILLTNRVELIEKMADFQLDLSKG